ncbi:PiggyBac transposable element-derived protein 4-like [Plakobranchus ocellatus]|uniref:PiggyBac transposable element-derived protein 4-like n=1 Tax=Plakobranchus ocellatus TaxID=259542 RepID=A0AAV4BFP4_9GAST|nr:PiggyBac transposable element-derived protein 4-like [Plakobranchus ocellatus]
MVAVHRNDQMVAYNAFKHCTLKWWKKAFFHLYMLGGLNAYIVQRATAAKKMSQRIFRRELALPTALSPLLRLPEGIEHSNLFRLTTRHLPQTIKAKPGAK